MLGSEGLGHMTSHKVGVSLISTLTQLRSHVAHFKNFFQEFAAKKECFCMILKLLPENIYTPPSL